MKEKFWISMESKHFASAERTGNNSEFSWILTHNNHIHISQSLDSIVNNGDNTKGKIFCYARLDTTKFPISGVLNLLMNASAHPEIPVIIEKALIGKLNETTHSF
jgi:hypothetical protein